MWRRESRLGYWAFPISVFLRQPAGGCHLVCEGRSLDGSFFNPEKYLLFTSCSLETVLWITLRPHLPHTFSPGLILNQCSANCEGSNLRVESHLESMFILDSGLTPTWYCLIIHIFYASHRKQQQLKMFPNLAAIFHSFIPSWVW